MFVRRFRTDNNFSFRKDEGIARSSSVLSEQEVRICAWGRARTADPSLFRRMLYQLSYPSIVSNYFGSIHDFTRLIQRFDMLNFTETITSTMPVYWHSDCYFHLRKKPYCPKFFNSSPMLLGICPAVSFIVSTPDTSEEYAPRTPSMYGCIK